MNEKQKTYLTEELTKEEREELISKIEGIANRNIKYHVLISETQRLIMKKAERTFTPASFGFALMELLETEEELEQYKKNSIQKEKRIGGI